MNLASSLSVRGLGLKFGWGTYEEDISNGHHYQPFKGTPTHTLKDPRGHKLRVAFHNMHIPQRSQQH